MKIADRITDQIYEGPDGTPFDQSKYYVVEERAPGSQGTEERGPTSTPMQPIEDTETVNSLGVPKWLMERLPDLPVGATAGGIAVPALAGMALGGPPGLLVGMGAGALGAMGGQSIQDLITKGAIDPMQTGIQGLLGAAGPLGGKFLSGAGTAIKGLGRMTGILPDIEGQALKTGLVNSTGIPEIIDKLRASTSSPAAARVADWIEETFGFPATKSLPKQFPSRLGMGEFNTIRDEIGSLSRQGGVNPKVSGEAYKGVMDILRWEAVSGNQAAVDMLQALAEKQGVKAITPSAYSAGLGGASGYGLWALSHRPGYVATAALAPYIAQAGSGLTKIGSMNPYLGAGVTTGEELLKSLLENQ